MRLPTRMIVMAAIVIAALNGTTLASVTAITWLDDVDDPFILQVEGVHDDGAGFGSTSHPVAVVSPGANWSVSLTVTENDAFFGGPDFFKVFVDIAQHITGVPGHGDNPTGNPLVGAMQEDLSSDDLVNLIVPPPSPFAGSWIDRRDPDGVFDGFTVPHLPSHEDGYQLYIAAEKISNVELGRWVVRVQGAHTGSSFVDLQLPSPSALCVLGAWGLFTPRRRRTCGQVLKQRQSRRWE